MLQNRPTRRLPVPSRRTDRPGFTLAELIVAVGAVALLTIGIGQIFSSVNRLVGTGAAIAETDQAARSIEARMRADFAALSRLRAEETFFAIRCRKIERTYLNRDEQDSDRRAGINQSDPNTLAKATRRLDEMMFLAFGGDGGAYTSAQIASGGSGYSVTAPISRIYYGHALRPMPDVTYDPDDPDSGRNVPKRHWVPDGDFGQLPGEINRFESGTVVTGRNAFAGEWQLVRQPLLLYGGWAAGPPTGSNARAPIPEGLAFAPYARDYNNRVRCAANDVRVEADNYHQWPRPGSNWKTFPRPLSFGRVDVCAQSPETLKRWLEGQPPRPPTAPATWRPSDATAFDGGRLNLSVVGNNPPYPTNVNNAVWDAPLWERSLDANLAHLANSFGIKGAIAGMFTRYLAESDPPMIERGDSLAAGGGPNSPNLTTNDPPNAALMDLHATLASRCSNFEIAWSDGTTWLYDAPLRIDRDGDGVFEVDLERGDIVWFDMNFYRRKGPGGNDDLSDSGRAAIYPALSTEPLPEVLPILRNEIARFPTASAERTAYPIGPAFRTGPNATYTCAAIDDEDEYLAIWGYRLPLPAPNVELGAPWPKPRLIRVRMTLHDAQFRIPGGRQYEFILPVNLK